MPSQTRTLGQMVNTRPVRRNMTPEEWAALQAQGSQGMERRVGPMSLAGLVDEALGAAGIPADPLDWALEGAGELANNPEVQKYLPFLPLLGLVRYKRPGVSASAREAAEKYHRAPVSDPVGEKSTVFHATDPSSLKTILGAGEIVPNAEAMKNYGLDTWDQYKRLKPLGNEEPVPKAVIDKAEEMAIALGKVDPATQQRLQRINWENIRQQGSPSNKGQPFWGFMVDMFGPNDSRQALSALGYREPHTLTSQRAEQLGGVSVSRVPRLASKSTRPLSFVIDRNKMPPSRPYAESDYQKTFGNAAPAWKVDEYGKPLMNPTFEFEDRTHGHAIPLSAAREVWVDKPAYLERFLPGTDREVKMQNLRDLVEQYGLPLREFESGREMHSGRARRK